MNMKDNI